MYQVSLRTILLISLLSALLAGGVVALFSNIQISQGQTRPQPVPVNFHLKEVAADEANNEAVYNHASPGVVSITSTTYVRSFFEVYPKEGTGSGSIIDEQGHILTNYHVIAGAQELDVALADKSHYKARLVGADPSNDLAVIKITAPRDKLNVIKLGTSANLRIGQKVLAIGNPFGWNQTLTTGIISGLGRPLRAPDGRLIESVIQTDAAINPGNSGGPLLNARGEIIGINTAIYSPSGGSVGIGFAVPVDKAKEIIPDLIALGRARKPWLGVVTYPLDASLAARLDMPVKQGLMVIDIARNSPAETAGLQVGDIPVTDGAARFFLGGDVIVKIDDREINTTDDLTSALNRRKIGDTVTIEVVRNRRTVTLTARLGEQPARTRL